MINFSHVVIGLISIAVLVLALVPIRWIIDSEKLSVGQKTYWVIVVVVFPVLGSLAWLAVGKNRA
jgi:hypothetical protein